MKNLLKLILILPVFLLLLVAPVALADEVVLENPITPENPPELFMGILNYVLGFLGVLAVAMIVYGGFIYMTSAGNEERVKSGRAILTYAIVGLLIVILSWVIVRAIITALGG